MPRKSMTKEKESPIVKFRVDSDVQDILEDLKAQDKNISKFIRESIKNTDTDILKKLIPEFAKADIEIDLDEKEIARIQELSQEVLQ